ncbi:MAG: AMP-binding protein, partial [Planctomycetota bacterium]|nr:AMP-binding protein [Planctomycetota bacterium]
MKAADLPLHYNAVDILERNLPHRADKTALFAVEREATFQEVSAEVNRVGNAVRAAGLHMGECVAILAPDSVEWVTAYFGTIKAGAVALSLNTLLTPAEFAYMMADCRARVLIVHEALLDKVDG